MLKKRRALSSAWVNKTSRQIQRLALGLDKFHDAETVALFFSMNREPETSELMRKTWQCGKTVLLPKAQDKAGSTHPVGATSSAYYFTLYTLDEALIPGPFGIFEPKFHKPSSGNIDLVFVPGVAFSTSGQRIGHGKGIYDRLLAEFQGIKAGLAFDFQLCEPWKNEKHDIDVDFVITEQQIYVI